MEREKMFRYNRFYLIFSLAFSYIVPFLTIRKTVPKPENIQIFFEERVSEISLTANIPQGINWENVLWTLYILISFFLLLKAVVSIFKILKTKGEIIKYQGFKIKILSRNTSPFSFWNTIFVGRNHFENQEITDAVFLHEKAHLQQKHSLDLLFLEILKIFSWWNPALYFYRKAIVTNHEFLADEAVLKKGFAIKEYQNLILQEIVVQPNSQFAHSFNYTNTKKRFIMMTFKNSKLLGAKKLLSISVLITAFFFFVQKAYAVEKTEPTSKFAQTEKKMKEKNTVAVQDTIRKNRSEDRYKKAEIKQITKKQKLIEKDNIPPPPPPMRDFTQAEFPGGFNEFRRKVASNFNTAVFAGNEGNAKATLYISIDEKGKVKKVTAEGSNRNFNNEAKRVVTEITKAEHFIPAKSGDKNVSTVFQLPIKMSFQK